MRRQPFFLVFVSCMIIIRTMNTNTLIFLLHAVYLIASAQSARHNSCYNASSIAHIAHRTET